MPKTIATFDRLLNHAHLCATTGDSIPLAQATTGKGVTSLTSPLDLVAASARILVALDNHAGTVRKRARGRGPIPSDRYYPAQVKGYDHSVHPHVVRRDELENIQGAIE